MARQVSGEKASYSIYLVGHFNRADLPAFDEFQALSRSHLSAIRNTFISMGSAIKSPLGKKTSDLTFHVELRDTYASRTGLPAHHSVVEPFGKRKSPATKLPGSR